MIKTMYTETLAVVSVNGHLTSEIQVNGGVRQGCPLSCYLYILVVEMLAERIRNNANIQGVVEPTTQQETKVSFFADDTAGLIQGPDCMKSIGAMRQDIKVFEAATGAKLNDDKTFMLAMSSMREKWKDIYLAAYGINFSFKENDEVEKYLGDMIGNNVTEEQRYESALKKMNSAAGLWGIQKMT